MQLFRNVFTATTLTLLLGVLAPPGWAQEFRILVTNDDGINSPQLAALAAALAELPNVEVLIS
ncbi:MAG: hypothetical protein KDI29_16915, partial [Pseudomonadales bacterium]|nr:hypothetical protein [Pseudomonadales bacterium]